MGHFHLSQGIFGPTEIRILLILGNAVLLVNPYADIFGHRVLVFDIGGAVAIVGMGYMAMAAAIRHTAVLYREEKLDDC
jgi:archaetidylinositol phosphate synthase